jgi:hypothetical protein
MQEVAAEKTAAANTEAGGYVGESTHPSTDVDDSTNDASEGARSSENTADVKSEIPGKSPDDLSEGDAGPAQDDRQLNMGTQQSATGEDPSVENDFKGDKDDPGTTHPADTKDGEKFGSLEQACEDASFMQAKTAALELGNDVLADFANGFGFGEVQIQKKAQAPLVDQRQYSQPVAPPAEKQAAVDPEAQAAADAGYQLASILGMEKLSEEERSAATIKQTIKDASYDADLVGSYLHTLANEAEKQAEGLDEELMVDGGEDDLGGIPGTQEGEDIGGEGMPIGADEVDPGAGILEEMAGGEGGELPPELGGELGGGEGDIEEDGLPSKEVLLEVIEELVSAEGEDPAAAVSPDEALEGVGNGMSEMGIPEEELAAAGADGAKLASALKSFKRSGKFRLKEATSDRERKIRDLMKAHVLELIG